MAEGYYTRAPTGPELDRLSASFAKLFRDGHAGHGFHPSVVTQQPMHPFGSQISTTSGVGIPMTFGRPPPMSPPPIPQMVNHQQPHHSVGIPLPGFDILDRVPFIKVVDAGILSGSYTCSPGYKIFNLQGEPLLKGNTSKLFCPMDSKMKCVQIKDLNDDCLFQVKFTPSVCECDSEEKRCFAVFSPLYENPFGAVLFEAGQLKYSLKVLNALEGETFAVQFLSKTDISIKGADGSIVAIINMQKKRGESKKYTLTFTEELSSANKALFIACIITLDLVGCEACCSKCVCLTPILMGTLTICGLTIGSYWETKTGHNPRP